MNTPEIPIDISLDSQFRDYLMPAIAGQYSCIYSSAKSIDYLGRLKFNQLAILNLIRQLRKDNHLDLAELQERLNSFDLENSFATNAMAHIGAHILQKADPRDRQHGLVTAALKVAEDDQFSALLRWVAKRQANWEEKLSDNMDLKEEALSLNQFVLETFKELQDPRKSVTEIVYEYSSVIAVGGVTSLIGMFALNPILAFSAGAASGLLAKLASRQDSPNSIPFINPRSRYLGALDLTLNDVIPAEKVDGRLKDIWS
ncbi:MAG: hypothetical protein O2861_01110 [Proteobacteria bacterium]|nr:hypothetical protein [Pseudomonadota bacterium]